MVCRGTPQWPVWPWLCSQMSCLRDWAHSSLEVPGLHVPCVHLVLGAEDEEDLPCRVLVLNPAIVFKGEVRSSQAEHKLGGAGGQREGTSEAESTACGEPDTGLDP